MNCDVIIIGGGIIGLSTAYQITKTTPWKKIMILEKEIEVGLHQTGHNSGVIHSGIYYKPGSLKAKLCRKGIIDLTQFCDQKGIRFEMCGKVIIASEKQQLPLLDMLIQRGKENGIKNLKKLSSYDIKHYEPYAEGQAGIFCPETGIIDYNDVCNALKEDFEKFGEIKLGHEATKIELDGNKVIVHSGKKTFKTSFLINCAGLFSDKIAKLAKMENRIKIVPFRGEYYSLKKESRYLVKNLIYPVPNPMYPFLGVHFTRTINRDIECGPNAVFTFKREGYNKTDFSFKDTLQALAFRGTWKLFINHWKFGINEYRRAFSKYLFLKEIRKMIPTLNMDDIVQQRSGVRAMALAKNGEVIDDFLIVKSKKNIHILNAPSPAATACISIAKKIMIDASDYFKI
mgnify:CR=1 FL=1